MDQRSAQFLVFTAALIGSPVLANDLVWTGGGDGMSFGDLANWDGDPTGGVIDMNALVDDFVIDDPDACVGCPGGVSQLTWVDEGVGSLTMSGGEFVGATGLRYTTFTFTGGEMTRQFLLNVTATLEGDASLTLAGGGDPVNQSTIALESLDALVHFTNELPEDVTAEHLSKISFFGQPAIEGVTYTLESDGASGALLQALEGDYDPATLEWTGAGDGTSFGDAANWDGTPTGGEVDLNHLLDIYVVGEGDDVGGEGVGQMFLLAQARLDMTGGILRQNLANGMAGVTGGVVNVSGGVLERQFFSMCAATISGSAHVILNGGSDPVPNATINLEGEDCTLTFLNESVEDFMLEHYEKIFVDGEPAELDVTLFVEPYGDMGCELTASPAGSCVGDLNLDGTVNGADVGIFLAYWGATEGIADINGDGVINGADLGLLMAGWGPCPVDPCEDADCDDNDPCTIDACEPKTGECIHTPIDGCGEGGCGDPASGSCSEANGSPACSDADCCLGVCVLDAYCCEVEWDASCVALTKQVPEC